MTRMIRVGLLLAVCVGLGGLVVPCSHSANLHFQAIDSVQFPSAYPILQWRLVDINGDGYDELIAMTHDKYFVYSFATASVILSNTSASKYYGFLITDFDHNGQADLVALNQYRVLSLQSGFDSANEAPLDSLTTFIDWVGDPTSWVNMMMVDTDGSGDSVLMLTGLAEFLVSLDWPRDLEYYYGGAVAQFSRFGGTATWVRSGSYQPSAEFADCLHLAGDARQFLCTWGHDYQMTSYHDYYKGWVHVPKYSFQFCVYDLSGRAIKASWGNSGVGALGGDFIENRPGDEILVFKDGPSFDSIDFKPSVVWGTYCLGIEGDTLSMLWGRDAPTSPIIKAFKLTSVPHTFCGWTDYYHCRIFSGTDGSEIGTVDGLLPEIETREGRFRAGSDSLLQVVQVSGTKAILMQQQEPTDVRDNSTSVPKSFVLRQNYPNPFNGGTTIRYSLQRPAQVKLEVLNMLGQVVVTLADGVQSKGEKSVVWTGTDSNGHPVASGTYIGKISIGSESGVIKMTLLK
jgi:hypothetical protein